jgi:uncharacterized protein (TIGR03000 family)
MRCHWLALAATIGLLGVASAQAGLFDQGIGSAMYYGPYTGGHGYSYNVAYGYGFAFSPADTWRRDPFAYPAGIYPYRPYDRPISCRVFPTPAVPYVSVPGPDGLPILVPSATPAGEPALPLTVAPTATPMLQPVPASAVAAQPATVRVSVPEGAEVWFDKEKLTQTGTERTFQSPPLPAGKMQIYSVRAKWNGGGREVEQFRVVGVRAGETARLTFPAARP